jgi:hypothetical protein
MTPFFKPLGAGTPPSWGVSFGRASEPRLEEERLQFLYRSISMDFGLEGINQTTGFSTRADVMGRALNWLLDTLRVTVTGVPAEDQSVALSAQAVSSAGVPITAYRWDFGDGSPIRSTTTSTTNHVYNNEGTYTIRVEAVDALGHRSIGRTSVRVGGQAGQ